VQMRGEEKRLKRKELRIEELSSRVVILLSVKSHWMKCHHGRELFFKVNSSCNQSRLMSLISHLPKCGVIEADKLSKTWRHNKSARNAYKDPGKLKHHQLSGLNCLILF
jgi:hypothetical protein